MDKEQSFARVVAHLMGDGCVTNRYLRYNNKSKFLLENFKEYFRDVFPEAYFIEGKVNSGTAFVQVQNKKIIWYLKDICKNFKSEFLEVPNFLTSLESKKVFISAIFDDEGCVGLRIFRKTNEIKRNLEIASKSRKFLEGIKDILENEFNIKCNRIISFQRNLKGKIFITWKLSITGKENFVRFRDKIGFTHPRKKNKLDLMISSYIRK